MAIYKVYYYIQSKQFAKIYFFTDGEEDFPIRSMEHIEHELNINSHKFINEEGEVKLKILLMSIEN